MPCRTTRELLDQIRGFHEQLAGFYARVSEEAERSRVKALLEHMSRHEERLQELLARYEDVAAQKVLDTWFEFMPEIAKCECFEGCIELSPDMSIGDVVRTALWFDDCLIEFFRELANLSTSSDVKDVFSNLAELEEQEERSMARAALEFAEGDS